MNYFHTEYDIGVLLARVGRVLHIPDHPDDPPAVFFVVKRGGASFCLLTY